MTHSVHSELNCAVDPVILNMCFSYVLLSCLQLRQTYPLFLSYQSSLLLEAISHYTQANNFPQGWLSVHHTDRSQIERLDSGVIVLAGLFVIV